MWPPRQGLDFLNACDGLHRDKWDEAMSVWKEAEKKLEEQVCTV